MRGSKSAFKVKFVIFSVFAFACFFAADSYAARLITVTSPNGGEVWQKRSTAVVTWTTSGFISGDKVDIQLSTNGGTSYTTIAPGVASYPDGNFSKTVNVPYISSTRCRIKIKLAGGTVNDRSDAYFRINAIPVLASIGNRSVSEGATLSFAISATDADNGTLTYSYSNIPAGSSFDPSTRTFTWIPGNNQAGTYSNVHFEVSDGTDTDSEDITITVNTASPPVLDAIGDKSILLGRALNFVISATDASGNPLTYSATGLPAGAAFDAGTRTFTMNPAYEAAGTSTTVHFEVSDGGVADSEDVKIEVKANPPIVAANLDGNATDELIIDFGAADGIWIFYNNFSWAQLHTLSSKSITVGNVDGDVNGIDDIIVDFGPVYGIWTYLNNTTWQLLHSVTAKSIAVGNVDGDINGMDDIIVDFGAADGIWIYYNNSTWLQLHNVTARSIAAGNVDGDINGMDDIIVDFGPSNGIWIRYNDSAWSQLHTASAEQIVAADMDDDGKDDIIIDFGAADGIWMRSNNTVWIQLHTVTPDSIIVVDLGANGKYLVIDFGAPYGVWATKGDGSWEQGSVDNPESITAADMDGDGFDDVVGDMSTGVGARYYVDGSVHDIHTVSP